MEAHVDPQVLQAPGEGPEAHAVLAGEGRQVLGLHQAHLPPKGRRRARFRPRKAVKRMGIRP